MKIHEGPRKGWRRIKRHAPKVGKAVKGQKGLVHERAIRTAAKPAGGASHLIAIYRDH